MHLFSLKLYQPDFDTTISSADTFLYFQDIILQIKSNSVIVKKR